MSATPTAVVYGTFLDDQGNPVVGLPVNLSLCTFHPQTGPWKITGVGILPNPPDTVTVVTNASGYFTVSLWGNDIIAVAGGGSYYQVQAGNFNGAFSFVQATQYNLLTASPLVPFPNTSPVAPPAGSQAAGTFYGGPSSGGPQIPAFRYIQTSDLPSSLISGEWTVGSGLTLANAITAATANGGGTVTIPTGTLITGPVAIPSNVNIVLGQGTFVNQNASGGNNFFQFNSGVTGASLTGQGVGITVLQNNTTAPQFGTVITDSGTNTTISGLTLDGNNNTTDTLLCRQSVSGSYRNLQILSVIPIGVTEVVGNGTTATVTMAANILAPNGIPNGSVFEIAGNTESTFNGQFTTASAGTTSFTFLSSTNTTGTGGFATVRYINNAVSVEGGSNHLFENIEGIGGPQDCFSLTTEEFSTNWGNIIGGRYSNIYVHTSPANGFSINALGAITTGKTITGLVINNLHAYENGYVGSTGGTDDESGVVLVANLSSSDNTAVSDCALSGIASYGNGGAGIRLKGNVVRCAFHGTSSNNGLRQSTADSQTIDGIVTLVGANESPSYNAFIISGNKGNATYIVNEASSSYGNTYYLASLDPCNLLGYSAYINDGGMMFRGSDFVTPLDTSTAIFNQSGIGATINTYEFEIYTGSSTPVLAMSIDTSQNGAFAGGLTIGGSTPNVGSGLGLGKTTSGTAGTGAATLPPNPTGFLEISIAGTIYKVPYYPVS